MSPSRALKQIASVLIIKSPWLAGGTARQSGSSTDSGHDGQHTSSVQRDRLQPEAVFCRVLSSASLRKNGEESKKVATMRCLGSQRCRGLMDLSRLQRRGEGVEGSAQLSSTRTQTLRPVVFCLAGLAPDGEA